MINDMLNLINDSYIVYGRDGKKYTLAESIYCPVAYSNLTEIMILANVGNKQMLYYTLSCEDKKKWDNARKLLVDINERNTYECLGEVIFAADDEYRKFMKLENQMKAVITELTNIALENNGCSALILEKDDLVVKDGKVDWGMKDKNPMEFIPLRGPCDDFSEEQEMSKMTYMHPARCNERKIRLYCKNLHVKNEAS